MKNMTLKNIADAVEGKLYCAPGEEDVEICGAVTDNRQVEAGNLFIPIRGERVDGHSFIDAAFENLAAAVFSERELKDAKGPYIRVASTPQALKRLAAFYRKQLTIPIVGIIGSVGKTSTKEMVASVISQKYDVLKTEGNFNNEIGLPLTIMKIRDHHQAAVVEMGISDFGEMHRLGEIAVPDIVVMTNIRECHLENLKDRDGVLKAKTEVFDHLMGDASVVLNGNDDKLASVRKVPGAKVYYAGIEDASFDIYADQIREEGLSGVQATFHLKQDGKESSFTAMIPLPGMHNVNNAALAAQVGILLGLDLSEIRAGMEDVRTIAGRSNFISLQNGVTLIDDCYNANPASMKASLNILRQARGRKIAILGDMGELGTDEKQLHYGVGKEAKACGIDVLFTIGDLSRNIADGAAGASGMEVQSFDEIEEMLPKLYALIAGGDTILVKASHFMNFQRIIKCMEERYGVMPS